ncbi:hypothetical protein IP90_00794 [Luteimonas cucumeris]|uniref:Uncharacterized protein n=1 Tax=Luteimonas cucumeris TaxID=985012 RepID=A0A562LAL2_9GAMM|nr:hypothetical protein IP90_00794 [Luteimonas cucumeris]
MPDRNGYPQVALGIVTSEQIQEVPAILASGARQAEDTLGQGNTNRYDDQRDDQPSVSQLQKFLDHHAPTRRSDQ